MVVKSVFPMTDTTDISHIRNLLTQVQDPEVPVLTIADLGILRNVELVDGIYEIKITPTFTGCPAMKAIEENISEVLVGNGIQNYKVRMVMFPAWTTDWISELGREKLRKYGIAPPSQSTEEHLKAILTGKNKAVACPFCGSVNTRLTSAFGSTACKALHYCDHCCQPFEEFKCH